MKSLKLTGRSRRMDRFLHSYGSAGLNLVSLMDIFTILVFFLLVNTSSQQLPNTKDLLLPTSVAKKVPEDTLAIVITRESILVQGYKVADLKTIDIAGDEIIVDLEKELLFHSSKAILSPDEESQGRYVTVFGDENVSYSILRKILATCRQANYLHIAFAAYQKGKA